MFENLSDPDDRVIYFNHHDSDDIVFPNVIRKKLERLGYTENNLLDLMYNVSSPPQQQQQDDNKTQPTIEIDNKDDDFDDDDDYDVVDNSIVEEELF